MLQIGSTSRRLCNSLDRRQFLQVGAIGAAGLSLPTLLQASGSNSPRAGSSFGQARRCLVLFLTGGPPQLDTWDMKPTAPARIRGELRPIATNVAGIHISELFPQVAEHADKLCIVRSVTHGDRTHTTAGYTMLTGVTHPSANAKSSADVRPSVHDHPHIGALLARVRTSDSHAPVFAALPEVIRDANVNEFPGQDGGLLGNRYAPFRIEADARRASFEKPDIFLPPGISTHRLDDRRGLLQQFDRRLSVFEGDVLKDMDGWYQKAFDVMSSAPVRQAFALDSEPLAIRQRYGNHLFGQSCLLGRRLIEAGVGLAAVYWHYEGPDDSPVWDTHQSNFPHLRQRLMPPTDAALSALLSDLHQRGLLADTLVVCMGEFGRSPLVNSLGGRDHWSAVQSIVLAGAGIRAGTVYGASDRDGGHPLENAVSPADVTATLMHLLGIPADLEIRDRTNRPMPACQGTPIDGILA